MWYFLGVKRMFGKVFHARLNHEQLMLSALGHNLICRLNGQCTGHHTDYDVGFMCFMYMLTEFYLFGTFSMFLQDFIRHSDIKLSKASKLRVAEFLEHYFRDIPRIFAQYAMDPTICTRADILEYVEPCIGGGPLVLCPMTLCGYQLKCAKSTPIRYLRGYKMALEKTPKEDSWNLFLTMLVDVSSGVLVPAYSAKITAADIYKFVRSGTAGIIDRDVYGIVHFDCVKNMLIDLHKKGTCSTPTGLTVEMKVNFVSKHTFSEFQECCEAYIAALQSDNLDSLYNAIECYE